MRNVSYDELESRSIEDMSFLWNCLHYLLDILWQKLKRLYSTPLKVVGDGGMLVKNTSIIKSNVLSIESFI